MPLGPSIHETMITEIRNDPEFARALLAEAPLSLLESDTPTAKITLRNLVRGTLGYKGLAEVTGTHEKSLHRMLGSTGNPKMDNLVVIADALRRALNAELRIQAV